MNPELDKRNLLIKLISVMNDSDTQQVLAYAAGYEAGKISQVSLSADQPRNFKKEQRIRRKEEV